MPAYCYMNLKKLAGLIDCIYLSFLDEAKRSIENQYSCK